MGDNDKDPKNTDDAPKRVVNVDPVTPEAAPLRAVPTESADKHATTLGKSYRGQQFVPIKTPDIVAADRKAARPYERKEGAITLDAYFGLRKVRDPVMRASMSKFTKVRKATPEDFDAIFKTH